LLVLAEYFADRILHPIGRQERGAELSGVARMALPLAVSAYIRSLLLSVEHNLIPKRLSARGDTRRDALSSYGALHGMALPMILYPMSPLSSFAGLLVPEFAESLGASDRDRMSRIATAAMNRTLAFATAVSAFLYLFSEELGYTVYSSYEAGKYIALLAPVVPIMYLDHVTDSVLKGIGEQVFSMWVNIADAAISVVLVFVLIPVFGISGYAFVIIAMEGFNYILSALRLRRRVKYRVDLLKSVIVPLVSAVGASVVSLSLFQQDGKSTSLLFLALRLVFAVAAFFAFYVPISGFLPYTFRRIADKIKLPSSNG
jgi:stage V sporulation protein B